MVTRAIGLALWAACLWGISWGQEQVEVAVRGYVHVGEDEVRVELLLREGAVAWLDGEGYEGAVRVLAEGIGEVAMAVEFEGEVSYDPVRGYVRDEKEGEGGLLAVRLWGLLVERPEVLEIEWRIFPELDGGVPVYVTGEPAFASTHLLTRERPGARVRLPALEEALLGSRVPLPPERGVLRLPVASLSCYGLAVVLGIVGRRWGGRRGPAVLGLAAMVLVMGAALGSWRPVELGRDHWEIELAEGEGEKIVWGLLEEIYGALALREEGAIYDRLAGVLEGGLLERVYLEMRRGLVLEEQGGSSVRVNSVSVRDLEAWPSPGGFGADVTWLAVGRVTHWGHTHTRVNRYRAEFLVEEVAGAWKVTRMELGEEVRL
jgi:hypothetical protein